MELICKHCGKPIEGGFIAMSIHERYDCSNNPNHEYPIQHTLIP